MKQKQPSSSAELTGIEKVRLDSVHCSGDTMTWTAENGRIYCYDKYFSDLFVFNGDGKLLERKLGYGRSNNESLIRGGITAAMSGEGELAIFGSSLDFELFSPDMILKNRFLITKDRRHTDPEEFLTYSSPLYDAAARLHDGKLYLGMTSDNPEFSYFFTDHDYLEAAYHVGVIDMESGKALPMQLKGFPPIYKSDPRKYVSFDYVDFDIDSKGNIYIGFQADSLIYKFDRNRKRTSVFCLSGSDMDMDYARVNGLDDVDKMGNNIETKGYYSKIEFIDETGLCFRSYRKGTHSGTDGLQVYDKKGREIGDYNVPKGLEITGYIPPFYYSQIYSDENSGELSVYRFKL